MDAKILLGKILQRFKDQKVAQVEGYSRFTYLKESNKSVWLIRSNGSSAEIPFNKVLVGIEAYQSKPELYKLGPMSLRNYGITHITSPVWTMLHVLDERDYQI